MTYRIGDTAFARSPSRIKRRPKAQAAAIETERPRIVNAPKLPDGWRKVVQP